MTAAGRPWPAPTAFGDAPGAAPGDPLGNTPGTTLGTPLGSALGGAPAGTAGAGRPGRGAPGRPTLRDLALGGLLLHAAPDGALGGPGAGDDPPPELVALAARVDPRALRRGGWADRVRDALAPPDAGHPGTTDDSGTARDPGAADDSGAADAVGHAALVALAAALGLAPVETLAVALAAAVEDDVLVGRAVARLQAPLAGSRPTLALLAVAFAPLATRPVESIAAGPAVACGLLALGTEGAPLHERVASVPLHLCLALRGWDAPPAGCALDPATPAQADEPACRLPPSTLAAARAHAAALQRGAGGARVLVVRAASPAEGQAAARAVADALGRRALWLEGAAPPGTAPWCRLAGLVPVWLLDLAPGERFALPALARHDGPVLAVCGPDGAVDARGAVAVPWPLPVPDAGERAALWAAALGESAAGGAGRAGGGDVASGGGPSRAGLSDDDPYGGGSLGNNALGDGALGGGLSRGGPAHGEVLGETPRPGALASALAEAHRHGSGRIAHVARVARHHAALAGRAAPGAADVAAAAWSLEGGGFEGLATPVPDRVGDDALVMPPALRAEMETLVLRCRARDGLARGLGPAAARYRAGVRALFVGPSGTGKTLAAAWLATRLGVPLWRVDLAAVTSKYIGETEKHLAQLLARAEHADVVLLFDEADSLFGKRTDVRDANDRFANAQTNYLLQRIETYEGVTLLTSNGRSRFDAAFARRLDAVVEFPLPDPEARRALWVAHLGDAHTLTGRELNVLAARADVAGGHVRNVVLAAAAVARAEGAPVGWAHVVRALDGEYRKLGRQVPAELGGAGGG